MNITLRRVKFHAFYILVKKSDVDCIIINFNVSLKNVGRFKQYESRSNADPFLGALVIMPNGMIKNSQLSQCVLNVGFGISFLMILI